MAQGQIEQWEKRDDPTITVEAVRLNEENVEAVGEWCGAVLVEEIDPEHVLETQYGLNINTNMGMARASLGMYVVKFGNGYVILHARPFEMVYKPSERPAPPLESAGDARKARGFADPFDSGRFGPI